MTFRVVNAAVGVVLTGLIYVAIALFARGGSVRRMAIVAAIAALPCADPAVVRLAARRDRANADATNSRAITTQEGVAIVQQRQQCPHRPGQWRRA